MKKCKCFQQNMLYLLYTVFHKHPSLIPVVAFCLCFYYSAVRALRAQFESQFLFARELIILWPFVRVGALTPRAEINKTVL